MSAAVLKYTLIVRHPDTDAPTALLVGESVPKWATDLVHADDLEDAASADTSNGKSDGGGEPGYGDQKVAELKQLIAVRNEGREEGDLISDDGVKADLVAALEADDAATADTSNE